MNKFLRSWTLALIAFAAVSFSRAAINPDDYMRIASDVLHLRQISRVEETQKTGKPHWRRVTIAAEVLAVANPARASARVGEVILIDYTVNLTEVEEARKAHAALGAMPGPQLMTEPEPPELDEKNSFWAYLAPAGGRLGNVNRHAGRMVFKNDEKRTGKVFVPVSGQYSFTLREPVRSQL